MHFYIMIETDTPLGLKQSNIFLSCFFFYLQTQRRLEQESEQRRKLEHILREKEKQLELETNTRLQISSSSAHSNEKVISLEKSVRVNSKIFMWLSLFLLVLVRISER